MGMRKCKRFIAIKHIIITSLLLFYLFTGHVNAQYASVQGNVIDENTDEPIAGAV
jgi:hypothetical protein